MNIRQAASLLAGLLAAFSVNASEQEYSTEQIKDTISFARESCGGIGGLAKSIANDRDDKVSLDEELSRYGDSGFSKYWISAVYSKELRRASPAQIHDLAIRSCLDSYGLK